MRHFPTCSQFPLPAMLGVCVVVGWAGSAANAENEPRYWAGDVSFVTPASYVEAKPTDVKPASAKPSTARLLPATPATDRPVTSQPAFSPRRSNASEWANEPRSTAGSVGTPDSVRTPAAPDADSSIAARPRPPRPVPWVPAVDPQLTNQTRQAIGFYGGLSARATLAQMPRRMPIQPSASRPLMPRSKPFTSATNRPPISPYLNLFRDESDSESAPNYFAFVLPQLEQQEADARQQRELQQLERQFQGGSPAAVGPQYGAAGSEVRGAAARFMDTAQFYSNWQ
jgi:hypothetical protein